MSQVVKYSRLGLLNGRVITSSALSHDRLILWFHDGTCVEIGVDPQHLYGDGRIEFATRDPWVDFADGHERRPCLERTCLACGMTETAEQFNSIHEMSRCPSCSSQKITVESDYVYREKEPAA